MTEIGARIMPYPAPQEHPADKEGSPTVSARYLDRVPGQQGCQRHAYGNSVQQSTSRLWTAKKFFDSMRRG
jgi:hypothetical protein